MELPDAIEHMRPAVVQIVVGTEETKPPGSPDEHILGTGFWVHDTGLVLTARHVTEAAQETIAKIPDAKLWVSLAYPNFAHRRGTMRNSFVSAPAEIAEEDPRHDIALIRTKKNPFATGQPSGLTSVGGGTVVNPLYGLASLSDESVRDGEAVAVSGYPLSESALVTTSGAIATAWGFEFKQEPIVRGPFLYIPDAADLYLADVAVNPGNSGGPVYRIKDGSVIGVCVAFRIGAGTLPQLPAPFHYNSGLTVVVPIRYGKALIERNV
jgi:serine protease Do